MRNKVIETVSPEDLMDYFGISEVRGKYLCPFHADTNPSMSIKGNLIRCWVCQDKAMNVINFTMAYRGVSFSDATKELCEIGNIDSTQENRAKTVNYGKTLQVIESKLRFAQNALLFDCNDITSIRKDIERLERKKRDLLSMMLTDERYVEGEIEKARESSDKSTTEFKRGRC